MLGQDHPHPRLERRERRRPRYEALQEAAEPQQAVAAALATVRAEGLEPSAEDLALFAEVAAGRLSTDELRERVLSRLRRADVQFRGSGSWAPGSPYGMPGP